SPRRGGAQTTRRAQMSRERPKPRGSKEALLQTILKELTAREREALHRLYALKESGKQVSRDLGFSEAELRTLRARIRLEVMAARHPKGSGN
ncbi:MAG TPA: hypothetical protein VKR43_22910, partial [Bryobacteraceae bacterium]|nr:hypothetical protein [Bryobacteraceae bacterium]